MENIQKGTVPPSGPADASRTENKTGRENKRTARSKTGKNSTPWVGAGHNSTPWTVLDEYRGKFFEGQWPSIPQLFNISEYRYPDRPCWECFTPKHEEFTYAQAKRIIDKVARWLVSMGVKKGDAVGLTGKNSPQWGFAYIAVMSVGAVLAPVDYTLTDAEIEHLFDFVEIKGLFVDGERFDRIGRDGKYGFKVSLEEKDHFDDYIFNLPFAEDASCTLPSGTDLAAYLFTSGTTGTPKAVMLSHENLVCDAFLVEGYMNVFPEDVFYAILPIQHAYAMTAVFIEAIAVGAKTVFGKRLVVNQIFKELKAGQVTMFMGVPLIFNKLMAGIMKGIEEQGKFKAALIKGLMGLSGFLKQRFHINIGRELFGAILDKISFSTVRICISGGGPLPAETFRRFNQLGVDFVQGYGLTETSPILTLNPTFDFEVTSIGKPIPGVEISFGEKDLHGNGEIMVKGPMVMQGYYNNPEATAEIIDKDHWLHTGDVGHIDSRNFVYLTGRAKNIIVTEGGKNVFPEEIEDLFQLYFDIEQICVLGFLADPATKSEECCAVIYPSADWTKQPHTPEETRQHFEALVEEVNKELLPYKRIRRTVIIDEPMEVSSTKKIKRFKVAEKYWDRINR